MRSLVAASCDLRPVLRQAGAPVRHDAIGPRSNIIKEFPFPLRSSVTISLPEAGRHLITSFMPRLVKSADAAEGFTAAGGTAGAGVRVSFRS